MSDTMIPSRPVEHHQGDAKRYSTPLNVKSNGKLRQAAGLNKQGNVNRSKAEQLAQGHGIEAERARFFLNVLSKHD